MLSRILQRSCWGAPPAKWSVDDGGSVDEAYFKRALPVMDERLALAGVRLAALLNQALGN
jgi:hypothetical protein